MKRVVIVKEGDYGMLSTVKGDYDSWIDLIKRWIENAKKPAGFLTKKEEKAATCEVVETAKEAWEKAEKGQVNIVVFKSRSMIAKAHKFQEKFPRLRVVLFTALWPEGELVIIDKKWVLNAEIAQEMILG
jgi:predicted CopG family antitoxin